MQETIEIIMRNYEKMWAFKWKTKAEIEEFRQKIIAHSEKIHKKANKIREQNKNKK